MTASHTGPTPLETLHADLMARWPETRIEPSLARIARLMELLGDPQHSYATIHVTGTNGKTSTGRLIESLLRAFGLRTGLFTSPHLSSVTERVLVDGEPLADDAFVAAYADIAPYVEIVDAESVTSGGPAMSYFEVVTALAFAHFADVPVDVAVIEVGMGGMWDATNVVDGRVAVVTPIDLDHAEYLGTTIEEVAAEKAGIIKPGSTAVLAAQTPEAAAVLLARCAAMEATVLREGVEFAVTGRELAVGGQVISVQTSSGAGAAVDGSSGEVTLTVYPDLLLPLHGPHQAQNAALALAAVEAFLSDGSRSLDVDIVREGFAVASSPGRLEIVRRSPTVIVDAAHNPHGARALAGALADGFAFESLVGVVAVLADKDARAILEALDPVLDEIVVTVNGSPRALPVEELATLARSVLGDERVREAASVADAVELAVARADELGLGAGGSGVIVTGSVVTAAEARALLATPSGDPS